MAFFRVDPLAVAVAVAVAVATSVGRLVGWQGQWRGWAWRLHTVGIAQIHLGINLFRSKFYLGCPDTPHKFFILFRI